MAHSFLQRKDRDRQHTLAVLSAPVLFGILAATTRVQTFVALGGEG
jgi:hypothetical protein